MEKDSSPQPDEGAEGRRNNEKRSGRGEDQAANRGKPPRNSRHRRMSPPRSRGWQGCNEVKRRRSRSRSPDEYHYHKRPRGSRHLELYPGRPMSPGGRYGRSDFGPPVFDHPPSFNHPMSDRAGPYPPFDRPVSPYSHPPYDRTHYNRYKRMPYDRPSMDRPYHSTYDDDCLPFEHPGRDRPPHERSPFMHSSIDRIPYEGRMLDQRPTAFPTMPRRAPTATVTRRAAENAQRNWQAETNDHTVSNEACQEIGTSRNSAADFVDELSLLHADGMDVHNGESPVDSHNLQQNNYGTNFTLTNSSSFGNWSDMSPSGTFRGRTSRGNFAGGRGANRGTRGREVTVGASTPRGHARVVGNPIARGAMARGTSAMANINGNRGGKVFVRAKVKPAHQFQPVQNKVHSLANIKQPDAANMSTAEKLHRFGLFLRNETLKENSIQTVENALTACKLHLKSHYEACELLKYAGRSMFTGCLYIGGQFIIRAVGATKKELKHDVYTQALSILTTNSVVDILGKKDQGLGVIRDELMESLKSSQESATAAAAAAASNTDQSDSQASGLTAAFLSLVNLLKTRTVMADNQISVLEQSISMAHCGLKTEFKCEEGRVSSGKRLFRVLLKLGDVLISEGRGSKKKDAKHAAYSNAVKAFKTRTVDDLTKGENVEGSQPDEQWTSLENSQGSGPSSQKAMRKSMKNVKLNLAEGFSLEKQLTKLMDGLKDSSFRLNNVNSIDCLALRLALTPVCYYRKDEMAQMSPLITCDLYINNIFVGTGESNTKKEAQIQAYNKAWELLTTTAPTVLLTQQPRKLASDPPDPNVFDKVVKGSGKYGDSNVDRLNHLKIDAYQNWKTIDDLVILEHSDWVNDRERHAFCILNQSATSSGLLMEWAFTGMQGGIYECCINLQTQQVGYGKASTKQSARGRASQMAMNRFYRTQPIIQIMRRDDSQLWLSWNDLQEEAIEWIPPQDYISRAPLDSDLFTTAKKGSSTAAQKGPSTAAQKGSSTAAQKGSSTAAQEGSSTAAQAGSSTAAQAGSSTAAQAGSSTAAQEGSSTAAQEGSSAAAQEGSSTNAQEGSSTNAQEGSSTNAQEGSSTAAQEGSSTAAQEGSSTAAQEGSSTVILNMKVLRYGTYLIEQMLSVDNLEDLIFDIEMPRPEAKALSHQALRLKTKVDQNVYGGEKYITIMRKMSLDLMVECLRRNGGQSGKYVLLTEEERPVLNIAKTSSNLNEPQDDEDDLPDEGGSNWPNSDENAS